MSLPLPTGSRTWGMKLHWDEACALREQATCGRAIDCARWLGSARNRIGVGYPRLARSRMSSVCLVLILCSTLAGKLMSAASASMGTASPTNVCCQLSKQISTLDARPHGQASPTQEHGRVEPEAARARCVHAAGRLRFPALRHPVVADRQFWAVICSQERRGVFRRRCIVQTRAGTFRVRLALSAIP